MTILEVWMAVCDGLSGVGSVTQGVGLIGVTFDNQTVTARTSKKPCPAGFFDDTSSNNLTIEVGTHPGGLEDHRRTWGIHTYIRDTALSINLLYVSM